MKVLKWFIGITLLVLGISAILLYTKCRVKRSN